jgi:hypothetical protein
LIWIKKRPDTAGREQVLKLLAEEKDPPLSKEASSHKAFMQMRNCHARLPKGQLRRSF